MLKNNVNIEFDVLSKILSSMTYTQKIDLYLA